MNKRLLKLNIGCSSERLNGYINIDKFNPNAEFLMDAVKLYFLDNSVDEIFTSHMIEHLTYNQLMRALKEWKRVLKKGGFLIIKCPNFEKHLKNWLNSNYRERWGQNNEGVNNILGFQDKGLGHINRNIFTSDRLRDLVTKAGFKVIECHPSLNRYGNIPEGDIFLRAVNS